ITPSPSITPKPHSNSSQIFLTPFSLESLNTTQRSPPILNIHSPTILPTPPPPFQYIPESFSQCLLVIHPLRGKTLISSKFL
ncbi:hypothetical protein, partial [Klebsiella pneumoniae]|uniref:hypothetical protein n=1 Tax=Klebsiella pneumoniae TaxID=573 RepID=UPI001C4E756B